jgi:hypothetical protein
VEGGTHSPGGEGDGGSIFWKTREMDCHLTVQYVLCGAPPPSASWTENTNITECTQKVTIASLRILSIVCSGSGRLYGVPALLLWNEEMFITKAHNAIMQSGTLVRPARPQAQRVSRPGGDSGGPGRREFGQCGTEKPLPRRRGRRPARRTSGQQAGWRGGGAQGVAGRRSSRCQWDLLLPLENSSTRPTPVRVV